MSKVKEKWEFYGENDPYFAVLTFDKYKAENLNEDYKKEFFETGEEHFVKIWKTVESHYKNEFKPKKALDFGCGVGRLVVPLANRCETVTGIDISQKMLAEARENCKIRNLHNTEFFQTDDFLTYPADDYDFIHSFIVFQHINPKIGEKIIENLVGRLAGGGVGVLHLTYFNPGSKLNWFRFKLYRDFPIVNGLKNLIKRTKQEPCIPMYLYDLNSVLAILQRNNCHKTVIKFSDHGFYGAVIFFQKNENIEF